MFSMMPYCSSKPVHYEPMTDRFLRSFFDWAPMNPAGFRVDVKENEDAYTLEAELAGVKKDEIQISVDHDVLTISADMNAEKKEQKDSYVYSERRSGHVSRSFSLEGIDQESIQADYKDGVLTVTLPKAKPETPKTARTIAIGGGEAGAEPEA